MINQFRNFTPLNLIFLVPLTILLCIGTLINLPSDLRQSIFEPAILNLIRSSPKQYLFAEANILISAGLTLIQAIYLNQVVNKYNLLGRSTFLPALLYVSMASMFTPFLILSPTLICNFLLIGMIDKLLSIYYRIDNKTVMFDLGLIIAIGTLFYFPFILMFLMLWTSLLIFKPFNWREWLTGLIGFSVIYFILFVIYFWLGLTSEFYKIWTPITHPSFSSHSNFDLHDYLALVIPIIILILFIISLQKSFYKNTIHIRKAFQLLFFVFILGLASFYLNPTHQEYHFLLCVPPLAIYMAYYFNYARIRWVYESLFILMLIGFIYFQWF